MHAHLMTAQQNKYMIPFIIVTVLFFLWGFITVLVDAFVPRLKEVFELNNFQAGIVQFAFFTAYAVFSIPGGALISRVGYKKGAVIGLVTMGVACLLFYPAAEFRVFGIFLLGMFVLAGGITILQVAANPYVAALGPAETASSRLNLSQALNSLGTAIAPLVSAAFILSSSVATSEEIAAMSAAAKEAYFTAEAAAVQGPFLVLSAVIILIAVAFGMAKLPKILEGDEHNHGSYKIALSHKHLMYGAIGIFVYVGAEVTIGSYLVNYFLTLDVVTLVKESGFMPGLAEFLAGTGIDSMTPAQLAGTFVTFYWSGAMVGRFIGAYLTRVVKPNRLLALYGLINVVLLIISMISGGLISFWSILAIGLFNSIMFPTIFTLAIDGIKEHTAQASGILCTAIVGGAFIPPLYGAVADGIGLQYALLIPLFCYLYISWYGKVGSEMKSATA